MISLFNPFISMTKRLRAPEQFLLVSVFFLAPLGLITAWLTVHFNAQIATDNDAQQGMAAYRLQGPLLSHLLDARNIEAVSKSTGASVQGKITRCFDLIADDIRDLDAQHSGASTSLNSSGSWQLWKRNWNEFRASSTATSPSDQAIRLTDLAAQIKALRSHAAFQCSFALDPDLASHNLAEMTFRGLPGLEDALDIKQAEDEASSNGNRASASSSAMALRALLAEQANGLEAIDALLSQRIRALELKRNGMLALVCVSGMIGLYGLMSVCLSIRKAEGDVASMLKQLSAGGDATYPMSSDHDRSNGLAVSMHQVCSSLLRKAEELRYDKEALQRDILDHKQLVEYRASHDTLTGLPNRAYFLHRLEAALANPKPGLAPVAVMFLDLLNFKSINDSLGHNAGDHILQAIAARLSDSVPADASIARLNSEEFAVLVEGLPSMDDVFRIADDILHEIRKAVTMANINVYPSGTIGIAVCTTAERDAEGVLHDAETAMYHARSEGPEPYAVFESSMTDKITDRTQLESELHHALERDEFVVHYQPLISLETGTMSGAEALIRWNHPRLGFVQPGRFLPIAEETGLIVPIGYWVLREACREAKEWQNNHPSAPAFTINVNLSGRQLERDDVVEQVSAALNETGINPSLLKLEITESVMMKDVDKTVAKLHSLKALGIKLAMDDFGTGYSSIACLNLFPLDTVKIDRSFVQSLADQPQAMSIVAAIISLARALNMDVTGEGVETVEHVTFLQSMGCHVGQGYYFAKALPSTAITQKVNAGARASIVSSDAAERVLIERLLRAA